MAQAPRRVVPSQQRRAPTHHCHCCCPCDLTAKGLGPLIFLEHPNAGSAQSNLSRSLCLSGVPSSASKVSLIFLCPLPSSQSVEWKDFVCSLFSSWSRHGTSSRFYFPFPFIATLFSPFRLTDNPPPIPLVYRWTLGCFVDRSREPLHRRTAHRTERPSTTTQRETRRNDQRDCRASPCTLACRTERSLEVGWLTTVWGFLPVCACCVDIWRFHACCALLSPRYSTRPDPASFSPSPPNAR